MDVDADKEKQKDKVLTEKCNANRNWRIHYIIKQRMRPTLTKSKGRRARKYEVRAGEP